MARPSLQLSATATPQLSTSSATKHLPASPVDATIQSTLTQANWRQKQVVACQITAKLTAQQIQQLNPATLQVLKTALTTGRITDLARAAIERLQTQCDELRLAIQPRLQVQGTPGFVRLVQTHLNNLQRLSLGRKLFQQLKASGRNVTIIQAPRMSEAVPSNLPAALEKDATLTWQDEYGKGRRLRGTGLGSDTTIRYNPQLTCTKATVAWGNCPAEIGLVHELIHAYDAAYGQLAAGEFMGVRNYERQAIGLKPYEVREFTENNFRAAWPGMVPLRLAY